MPRRPPLVSIALLVSITSLAPLACDGAERDEADRDDATSDQRADASADAVATSATWPDDVVVPTTSPDPEEAGTLGCTFGNDVTACRLNVAGPGVMAVDLGEGVRGYARTLRAEWRGGDGLFDDGGHALLGWADPGDAHGGDPQPIVVAPMLEPRATTTIEIIANFDALSPTTTLDGTYPQESPSLRTTLTIYDSLGVAHQVDLYAYNLGDGDWAWHLFSTASEIDGSSDTTPLLIGEGTLAFDTNGGLVGQTCDDMSVTFSAASPQPLRVAFGDPPSGLASTMTAGPPAIGSIDQDGSPAGWPSRLELDWRGRITVAYSNGLERSAGQIAVALFDAPEELHAIGPHLWVETAASGAPSIGRPGEGDRGTIDAWSLALAPP